MSETKSKRPIWPYLLFLIGVFSLLIRYLLDSQWGNAALLYVAVPFLVSFALFRFTGRPKKGTVFRRFLAHMRDATIIMLATSAILFEGFICVLMFMPIYYAVVCIYFAAEAFEARYKARKDRSRLRASVVPVLIAFLSIEGLTPSTSFERENTVTRTMVINGSIDAIKANIAAPIDLPPRRNWFLSIFPNPVEVKAGSLEAGDVHTLKFVYKRWFYTNVHEGDFHLRIDEVSDRHIRTSVQKNTSYLAKYLRLKGTEIKFIPVGETQTRVELSLHYDRLLDPAWYFGPMQRYAIEESGDYLLETVIARDLSHE